MNCTGTEKQRAIVAAFKMRPEAEQREIASAAGVTELYAGTVIRDYLASRAHDQSLICQAPTRGTLSAVRDVAVFQRDKRLHAIPQGSNVTARQQAIQISLAENPRADGEGVMAYCRRLALIAGVHAGSVQHALDRIKNEAIGAAARAMEAEEAKSKVEVMPFSGNIGPVTNFTGWVDTFGRFKLLSDAHKTLALSRGDVYAAAFLSDISQISDRAQSRAAISKAG